MPSWLPADAIEGGGLPDNFDGTISEKTRFVERQSGDFAAVELHIVIDAPTVQKNKDYNVSEYPDGVTGERLLVGSAREWEVIDGGLRIKHRKLEHADLYKNSDLVWLAGMALDGGLPEEVLAEGSMDDGSLSCEPWFGQEFYWERTNPPDFERRMQRLVEKGKGTRTYTDRDGKKVTVPVDLKKLMPVKWLGGGSGVGGATVSVDQIVEDAVSDFVNDAGAPVAFTTLWASLRDGLRKDDRLKSSISIIARDFLTNKEWLGADDRPWVFDEEKGSLSPLVQ